MAGRGVISKAVDKLPTWAQRLFMAFAIIVAGFYIYRYGFWSFLLHALFSPVF